MRLSAPSRRTVLAGLAGASVAPRPARAQQGFTDGAGRRVIVPATVNRVFPAGPPAAILLYTLAPDLMLGWPRANRPEELEFLLPEIGARPELGRLTGRGDTTNVEVVLALKPDLILDAGSTRRTFVELAERVQARTGVATALLDGSFPKIPETYRLLGAMLGRRERAEELARYAEETLAEVSRRVIGIPEAERPRVYYARGPRGLETGLAGSINVEILDVMGVRNVALGERGGLAVVSLEQVLRWDPEVIITIDQDFAASVGSDPLWASVRAVRAGRVHLSPKLPFGWVDFPPGVNRLIGLWWVGKMVYPERFPEDLAEITRRFYALFYQVRLTDAQIARVLAGRD